MINKNNVNKKIIPFYIVILILHIVIQFFAVLYKGGIEIFPETILASLLVLTLVAGAVVHGIRNSGVKNLLVLFVLSFAVSWAFETLSVYTGFPFGRYVYSDMLGPKLGVVPLLIMPTYFSMGYFCFRMAGVLTSFIKGPVSKISALVIPVVAAFLMVMWNFTFDPVSSTIYGNWTWLEGGAYFGVPYSNFLGWMFVCFIYFALYSLYRYRSMRKTERMESNPIDLIYPILFYLLAGFQSVFTPLFIRDSGGIYESMSLGAVVTMVFASLIALINVYTKNISRKE